MVSRCLRFKLNPPPTPLPVEDSKPSPFSPSRSLSCFSCDNAIAQAISSTQPKPCPFSRPASLFPPPFFSLSPCRSPQPPHALAGPVRIDPLVFAFFRKTARCEFTVVYGLSIFTGLCSDLNSGWHNFPSHVTIRFCLGERLKWFQFLGDQSLSSVFGNLVS